MCASIIFLKFALLGDSVVGKTTLIEMYAHHKFREDYKPTLCVSICVKELEIEDIQIQLVIWDITGQAKYDLSRIMFLQGIVGVLFVYYITRYATFKNIESKWLEDLNEYGEKELYYILIGNKCDLNDSRIVFNKEGRTLPTKIKASDFIETSAKHGKNVKKLLKNW